MQALRYVRREDDVRLLSARTLAIFWCTVAALWGVAGVLLVLFDAHPFYRAPITIAFAGIIPGLMIVRLIRIPGTVAQVTLGLSLSLALGVLIPSLLLYLGAWSPLAALAILAGIAFAASFIEALRTLNEGARSP